MKCGLKGRAGSRIGAKNPALEIKRSAFYLYITLFYMKLSSGIEDFRSTNQIGHDFEGRTPKIEYCVRKATHESTKPVHKTAIV